MHTYIHTYVHTYKYCLTVPYLTLNYSAVHTQTHVCVYIYTHHAMPCHAMPCQATPGLAWPCQTQHMHHTYKHTRQTNQQAAHPCPERMKLRLPCIKPKIPHQTQASSAKPRNNNHDHKGERQGNMRGRKTQAHQRGPRGRGQGGGYNGVAGSSTPRLYLSRCSFSLWNRSPTQPIPSLLGLLRFSGTTLIMRPAM